MRIESPGIRRVQPPFQFRFDGRDIEAYPGETIAAALLNADIWALRRTRTGAPRGLYCGMGVCGECSVLVDGFQRRACLEEARPGNEVSTMPALAPVGTVEGSHGTGPAEPLSPDVLIVGAGPAGLSAAQLAASAGLDVLVVDERSKAGGQYFKQPARGFLLDGGKIDPQFAEGAALIAAAEAAGARFLFGATIWSAFGPNELVINCLGRTLHAAPRRIILSPGAYEQPHAVPGWTLPGVMTTGAAQTLLRAYQTVPGRRVLVAGNGPLNLQVARELLRAGAEVVALAELAPPLWAASPAASLAMLRYAPRLVREGLDHLLRLKAAKVPIHYRHVLIAAEGDEKVRRGRIAEVAADGSVRAGSERGFDVDAICTGYGFAPQNEIARAFGCLHRLDEGGALITERDGDGRTSLGQIFLAGDAGGLGGARVAMAQGRIAAAAAAHDLGASVDQADLRQAKRVLERHHAFQRALWRVYRPSAVPRNLAAPETLICRCEEVDRASADAVLETGVRSLGAAKRASRLGMGRCQGRYCGAQLAQMISQRCGEPVAAEAFFAPRSPFKPVTVASVSACFKE